MRRAAAKPVAKPAPPVEEIGDEEDEPELPEHAPWEEDELDDEVPWDEQEEDAAT